MLPGTRDQLPGASGVVVNQVVKERDGQSGRRDSKDEVRRTKDEGEVGANKLKKFSGEGMCTFV